MEENPVEASPGNPPPELHDLQIEPLQWMRGPGQARGREAKARATKLRNDGIRAMAEEFRADRKKKGRPAPSLAQTARHVRRKLEETAGPSRGQLSEKSLTDIISGRR